jgi:hypothetical protein
MSYPDVGINHCQHGKQRANNLADKKARQHIDVQQNYAIAQKPCDSKVRLFFRRFSLKLPFLGAAQQFTY